MDDERGRGQGASGGCARFRAFVSYAHADAAAARKLQRRLEAYRVPRRLMERVAPLASEHGGIGPVFRDSEDLSASADLTEAVKEALAASQALIVICSPNAPRSAWVAREIALFRALHPRRPILAALVAGDPATAFPPSLTAGGSEPLAADFRPGGDGRRLAFLKVVAGILMIPLDELLQRDAQRRQRSVIAVTAVSLAAALILSAMTVLAIAARNEAEQQRAEAEGLVEFMLTDLRADLKGVGRLALMQGVNQRALRYYRNQGDLAGAEAASLERRARVIGAMGEDWENAGRRDLAREHYLELHRTTAELLRKRPADPVRAFWHAGSENRLAVLAHAMGDAPQAFSRFRASRSLLARSAGWGRNRPEWVRLSALAAGNLCVLLQERGRAGEALGLCREAVASTERQIRLGPDDPALRYDLAFHYFWRARAELALRERAGMARSQEAYLALSRRLVADHPENLLYQEQRMELLAGHALMLREAGRSGEAMPFIRESYAINRRLVAHDPRNAHWARYRGRLLEMMKGEAI